MRRSFRISHIGLLGSAPLVHALATGAFEREGMQCELHHEIGDFTVLDRLLDGSIDALCAPATLSLAHGLAGRDSAIDWFVHTLITRSGFGLVLATGAGEILHASGTRPLPTLRIGVPMGATSAPLLVKRWHAERASTGLPEPKCLQVPLSQLFDFLTENVIDGFCVGDPLPAIAVGRGLGEIVATSESLAPDHPHTVLLSPAFSPLCSPANRRALARALGPSLEYCADPANRDAVVRLGLAMIPPRVLARADSDRLHARGPHGLAALFSTRFAAPHFPATLSTGDRSFLEESVLIAMGTSGRRAQVRARIDRSFPGTLASTG